MLTYCLGLPSRASEWCEALTAQLLQAAGQEASVIRAENFAQLGEALYRSAPGIAIARAPTMNLRRGLTDCPRGFVLMLSSPHDCVVDLVCDHRATFTEAVRITATSLSALLPLARASNALVLGRAALSNGIDPAVRIVAHLGLDLSADKVREVTESDLINTMFQHAKAPRKPINALQGVGAGASRQPSLVDEIFSAAGQETPSIIDGACASLWDGFGDIIMPGEIVWRRELFYGVDEPNAPPPPVIDVTGPIRCLLFGPYIRIPAGPWACTLVLACGPDSVGLRLLAEVVGGGNVLTRVTFGISQAGAFELEFSFVVSDPDQAIEIRLFNETAAFEGQVAFAEARLAPLRANRLYPR